MLLDVCRIMFTHGNRLSNTCQELPRARQVHCRSYRMHEVIKHGLPAEQVTSDIHPFLIALWAFQYRVHVRRLQEKGKKLIRKTDHGLGQCDVE